MYIERKIEGLVLKYMENKEFLVVVGARQVGKTTMMRHIFEKIDNSVWLSFEDLDLKDLFDSDIKSFLKIYWKYKYIFIDEFQYAQNWGRNLKYIYDSTDIKIILSWSSASQITVNSLKYMVWRAFVFTLYWFDFEEILSVKNKDLVWLYKDIQFDSVKENVNSIFNNIMNDILLYWSYPKVVITDDIDEKKLILKNIYNTYFLREIKELLWIVDDHNIRKLIKYLATQIWNLVNYSQIWNNLNLDYNKIKNYLSILEKTFISFNLHPYYINKQTELVKQPKIYFNDYWFRNICLNNFTIDGHLLENYVAWEIMKNMDSIEDYQNTIWMTKSGAEVDFVYETWWNVVPIEVKSNIKLWVVGKSFHSFVQKYNPSVWYIVNLNTIWEYKINNTTIKYIPFWMINRIFE